MSMQTFPDSKIHNFYTIREFFTWLKKPNHTPTSHPIAVVVPYTSKNYPVPDIPTTDFMGAFQLSIQSIQPPNYIIGTGTNISLPNGNWSNMTNTYPIARKQNFTNNFY